MTEPDCAMTPIVLPERCDRAAAEQMAPVLAAAARDGRIAVDGSAVEQIGQAMLQLLLSARRTGNGATIMPSRPFAETARLAGLSAELFEAEIFGDPQP